MIHCLTRPGLLRDDLPALLGLLPPALWLLRGDVWLAPRFVFCLLLVLGWQLLFAVLRRQGLTLNALVSAALIAILVPASAPFWQLALGVSFGIVLGEAIFGGRGRNFVQLVVLALAFMAFSFADHPWRNGPDLPAAAALPALALLVASGQARLPVLIGAAAGIFGLSWLAGTGKAETLLASGAILLALVYLTADAVASASTTAGRFVYGVLAGGLTVLFATAGPAFGALVFATLLAAIFAPLIDHLVVAAHTGLMQARQRRLRHGR